MARDPLPIVEEYLSSGEAQVRKNAAVALAVVGGREGFAELVRLALLDPDEKVRKCAAAEFRQIDDESAKSQALGCLYEALERPETVGSAGLLLARLRNDGLPVASPASDWRGRFRRIARPRTVAAGQRH